VQYHAVYKENEKQKFVENLGVVIMNVMIKQSYIAITSSNVQRIYDSRRNQTSSPKTAGEPSMGYPNGVAFPR